MAAAALFSEQELTCSICLDVFQEPVSTPCGHNYCQACIGGYWASSRAVSCPLCKRQFEERPQLAVNKVFALIAHNYKASRCGAAPGEEEEEEEEQVWCDMCTGVKRPALSSCLTCTASYCEEHLQPHRSSAFYARHPLRDPREALEGRTCPAHRRLLEVYCRSCQRCVCAVCVLEEHRTHLTVSVQTERLGKQTRGEEEQEILKRIREKEAHVSQLKRRLEGVKNYADGERREVELLLDQVSSSLDGIRSQVVGGIESQLEGVMLKGEGLVSRLEAELGQLADCRATLEVQAVSQDHIGFLQSFKEATAPLEEEQEEQEEQEEDLCPLPAGGGEGAYGGQMEDKMGAASEAQRACSV
ncbi:E3 ubiquitin-protein ligase TRIM47-like [Pseudoliparis swirei]|uniref:E3 ubiquitin-protein ligase TRIM47-like n=1 Tax=Pseudoliparis swirei TaxID=2059687 RepID=UPI0024BDC4A8|nr:E3 ubiquitin-protein ligase TRIM47-like [Pseudoliparis swirei]